MRSAIPNSIVSGSMIGRQVALLSQQFEHGVDGECVDVFHAASLVFFGRNG